MKQMLRRIRTRAGCFVREMVSDEDGVGVVEIILILVVLISLVVIFKKQVTAIVKDILSRASSDAGGI